MGISPNCKPSLPHERIPDQATETAARNRRKAPGKIGILHLQKCLFPEWENNLSNLNDTNTVYEKNKLVVVELNT